MSGEAEELVEEISLDESSRSDKRAPSHAPSAGSGASSGRARRSRDKKPEEPVEDISLDESSRSEKKTPSSGRARRSRDKKGEEPAEDASLDESSRSERKTPGSARGRRSKDKGGKEAGGEADEGRDGESRSRSPSSGKGWHESPRSSPRAAPRTFTIKAFRDDRYLGEVTVPPGAPWRDALAKLRGLDPSCAGFEFDDGEAREVTCDSAKAWPKALAALDRTADDVLNVALLGGGGGSPEKSEAGATPAKSVPGAGVGSPGSAADTPPAKLPPGKPPKSAKGKRETPKSTLVLTPGQKIFREKILKPRRAGVVDVLKSFSTMPANVCLSPLGQRFTCKHSASAPRSAAHASPPIAAPPLPPASRLVNLLVQLNAATGIPGLGDEYTVIQKKALMCVCDKPGKRFLGPAHTVPVAHKNTHKAEWVLSQKGVNPFLVRAEVGGSKVGLYVELCCVVRRKGTDTQGRAAIARGDIKELSCGHAFVPLVGTLKGKITCDVVGGTPWAEQAISDGDVPTQKPGGILKIIKKTVTKSTVDVTFSPFTGDAAHLPANVVCAAVCVDTLNNFAHIEAQALAGPDAELFVRPVCYDPVLAAFPRLSADAELLHSLALKWTAAGKKLGKRAGEADVEAAFRDCVTAFLPILTLPSVRAPPFGADTEAQEEERSKVVEAYCKQSDVSKILTGRTGLKFTPFRICEDVPWAS